VSEGNNPTGTARRRSTGEIESAFTEMLIGPEEQPAEESSEEEQLQTDSDDDGQEYEAELADDSVTDEEEAYEDEEFDDEQSEGEVRLFSVVVDGESHEVPLDELIGGYQRGSSFTKKSQQLAEERKDFDSERQALQQERQTYSEVLQTLQQQMEAARTPANFDWDALERQDPVQWLKLKELERQRAGEIQAVQAEQMRMQEVAAEQHSRDLQERLASERILMLEKIPEWQDSDVEAEEQRKLAEFGKTLGFSDDELNTVYDHRALVALYKAWKFDELMNGDKVQTAKSKIGSVKSGNRETARRTRSRKQKAQRARLKETGKVDDAAAIFSQILAE
jgi:hypothetical protein